MASNVNDVSFLDRAITRSVLMAKYSLVEGVADAYQAAKKTALLGLAVQTIRVIQDNEGHRMIGQTCLADHGAINGIIFNSCLIVAPAAALGCLWGALKGCYHACQLPIADHRRD